MQSEIPLSEVRWWLDRILGEVTHTGKGKKQDMVVSGQDWAALFPRLLHARLDHTAQPPLQAAFPPKGHEWKCYLLSAQPIQTPDG